VGWAADSAAGLVAVTVVETAAEMAAGLEAGWVVAMVAG
jgi:hypothetical protein